MDRSTTPSAALSVVWSTRRTSTPMPSSSRTILTTSFTCGSPRRSTARPTWPKLRNGLCRMGFRRSRPTWSNSSRSCRTPHAAARSADRGGPFIARGSMSSGRARPSVGSRSASRRGGEAAIAWWWGWRPVAHHQPRVCTSCAADPTCRTPPLLPDRLRHDVSLPDPGIQAWAPAPGPATRWGRLSEVNRRNGPDIDRFDDAGRLDRSVDSDLVI